MENVKIDLKKEEDKKEKKDNDKGNWIKWRKKVVKDKEEKIREEEKEPDKSFKNIVKLELLNEENKIKDKDKIDTK